MPDTPIYSIPYQGLNDEPDGAALGQGIAEAVEAELERIDAALANTDGAWDHETSNVDILTTGMVASGFGVAFDAPASGAVLIAWTDSLRHSWSGGSVVSREARSAIQVRTGGVIGSGTIVSDTDASPVALHGGTATAHDTRSTVGSTRRLTGRYLQRANFPPAQLDGQQRRGRQYGPHHLCGAVPVEPERPRPGRGRGRSVSGGC